jgi:hypothetical protein
MLKSILKRKLNDDQLANVFINVLVEATELSFEDISAGLNDDNAFVISPDLKSVDLEHFQFVVLAANVTLIQSTFDSIRATQLERVASRKLAGIFDTTVEEMSAKIKNYQSFIKRVNHPSKNLIYGMSKAIFAKYELHNFQDEYFKSLAAPNPLLIKRLNEITELFLWDWDAFFSKNRI